MARALTRVLTLTSTDFIGHHNPEFSKKKEFHFNSNTLKNAENHLRDIHFLDEGGDT